MRDDTDRLIALDYCQECEPESLTWKVWAIANCIRTELEINSQRLGWAISCVTLYPWTPGKTPHVTGTGGWLSNGRAGDRPPLHAQLIRLAAAACERRKLAK